jgi:WhiB family redox-sensing transcriptional regulator
MAKGQAIPGGRNIPGRFSMQWHEFAACSDQPVELFYGADSETHQERTIREDMALRVCARCLVRQQCEAHALQTPERYGVWGGTTEASRSAGRRKAAAA